MLICILVGFSSGLPLYFIMQFVPIWLRRHDVDLKAIGLIGLIQLPYAFKFLWAPLCDRYRFLRFGRRRGWMLATQVLLLFSMMAMGMLDPEMSLSLILVVGFVIAFFSATQDIVIDAFRRDILPNEELGLGNSLAVNSYRIAGMVPGGLGLILADVVSWQMTFFIISLFMIPGIICTLVVSEPEVPKGPPKSLKDAVIEPFVEFFSRSGIKPALMVLGFMFFYKFGDTLATALISPFYADLGFSNTEIGLMSKTVGFWSMIVGGLLGGLIMLRIGIYKSLWIFGFVQMFSILGFAALAEAGKNIYVFGLAVGFEYIGVGLGTAAFTAYIASQSRKRFSATQLALFSSFFALPRSVTGVFAGALVEGGWGIEAQGWTTFFYICFLAAIPGMILLYWVAPWGGEPEQE